MKQVVCKLKSASPYSQCKFVTVPKLPRELPQAYEERTWRERLHVTPQGTVFIPCFAFANSLKETAKFLSEQVPGKGKATWTKHFESGIMVPENLELPDRKENVIGEWLHVPSDGQRGGGRRVLKCFPMLPEWGGEVTYYVLDDTITEDVFLRHLKACGLLIGIGRFRPRNWGYYGRFTVQETTWQVLEL